MINLEERICALIKSMPKAEILKKQREKKNKNIDVDVF